MSFSAVSGGPVTWQPLGFLFLALCDLISLINYSLSALQSLAADTAVLVWILKPNNRTSVKVCLTSEQILSKTPWVKTRHFGISVLFRVSSSPAPFSLLGSKRSEVMRGRSLENRGTTDLLFPHSKKNGALAV